MPITDEFGGVLGNERNTCDPGFMRVMNNRAWMNAQREITQTKNLIARPDSVLSLSCFNQFLHHQAFYAARNFPGNPRQSRGGFGGIFTDFITVLPDEFISNIDPNQTNGYVMFAILEILVLDQLTRVDSFTGAAGDAVGLAVCGFEKENYIEDNFQDLMLGNRANGSGGYAGISANFFPNDVRDGAVYLCDTMNRVWQRGKCYDFATESALRETPPIPTEHDGFYTLQNYVDTAAAGRDYRVQVTACRPPDGDLFDIPSIGEIACNTVVHGIPALPAIGAFLPPPGPSPTWASADVASNPALSTPGAAQAVVNHYDLTTGGCSAPIQTGYIVAGDEGTYIDAVCPEPGCIFDPPTSLTGTGSCDFP